MRTIHYFYHDLAKRLVVPSIATEYTRNRAKHDQTARDWTRLYARPPPPPPPPAPASVSSRAKGKEKASVQGDDVHAQTEPRSVNASEVITIDDSDDEGNAGPRAAVRRQTGVKRKRGTDVVDVDLASDEESSARTRRRRTESNTHSVSEVIVIED